MFSITLMIPLSWKQKEAFAQSRKIILQCINLNKELLSNILISIIHR